MYFWEGLPSQFVGSTTLKRFVVAAPHHLIARSRANSVELSIFPAEMVSSLLEKSPFVCSVDIVAAGNGAYLCVREEDYIAGQKKPFPKESTAEYDANEPSQTLEMGHTMALSLAA
jgi:hypothetical protein